MNKNRLSIFSYTFLYSILLTLTFLLIDCVNSFTRGSIYLDFFFYSIYIISCAYIIFYIFYYLSCFKKDGEKRKAGHLNYFHFSIVLTVITLLIVFIYELLVHLSKDSHVCFINSSSDFKIEVIIGFIAMFMTLLTLSFTLPKDKTNKYICGLERNAWDYVRNKNKYYIEIKNYIYILIFYYFISAFFLFFKLIVSLITITLFLFIFSFIISIEQLPILMGNEECIRKNIQKFELRSVCISS